MTKNRFPHKFYPRALSRRDRSSGRPRLNCKLILFHTFLVFSSPNATKNAFQRDFYSFIPAGTSREFLHTQAHNKYKAYVYKRMKIRTGQHRVIRSPHIQQGWLFTHDMHVPSTLFHNR